MVVHESRPTMFGKPAFFDPPPWFWLMVELYNLAREEPFERPIIYSLNIFFCGYK
uniref:Uncharacterized protein n=1 Tax=viral metagenome TaxID=1070528 RepID=A0A6C0DYV5_9ZZZZ